MYIARVKVKNFRSLVDTEVNLGVYTALVGLNDVGKSNLLRALNLFFNKQTDIGQTLVFDNDFSQNAKVISKKAKQIEIEVEFTPPTNYADKGPIIWRKVYRAESIDPFTEELFRANGESFSKGSRAEYWVRHLAFEYVPAIRGKSFFASLKRRLYDTLAATVAPKLTKASDAFLSELRKEVRKIESESNRLLKLKTEFSLPGDLGELFEVLDFDSTDAHASTALQYRGDGIQGRHIPLILKFLADQRKTNSAKGKPVSETIWGFEEPENNLELTKQIDTAEEFKIYCSSVQIVVTTHSPAFYGTAKDLGGIRVATRLDGNTTFASSIDGEKMDSHLGLMPFIQPYLEKAARDRHLLVSELKKLDKEIVIKNKPALYVEGSSDRTIISAALNALQPDWKSYFEIVAKDGKNGSVNWAIGCCVARAATTDVEHRTAVLLDDDQAGRDGSRKLASVLEMLGRRDKVRIFVAGKLPADDHVRKIKSSKINIGWAIEELCSIDAWQYAEQKKLLSDRGSELLVDNSHLLTKAQTFESIVDAKIKDDNIRTVIYKKINAFKKGVFAEYIAQELKQGNLSLISPSLDDLIKRIYLYFKED